MKRGRINPSDPYFQYLANREFVFELDSGMPGPISCIAGFVHGNEQAGFFAMQELERTEIQFGKVFLVGGNPAALLADVRFVSKNLNRMHGNKTDAQIADALDSYERTEAERIMSVLQKSDALFDIHQSRDEVDFIICEPHSFDLARRFDVPWVLMGLDKYHPGGTDGYMNTLLKADGSPKNGICLEAGNMNAENQTENIRKAVLESSRFLALRGHFDSSKELPPVIRTPRVIRVFDEYLITEHLVFDNQPGSFDLLTVGQAIGTDGEQRIICPEKWNGCYIIFPTKDDDTPAGEQGFLVAKDFCPTHAGDWTIG